MFGKFKDMKLGAEAFTDGRWSILQTTGLDLDKSMNVGDKSDLMAKTVIKLKSLPDRQYSTTQMVISLWGCAIEIAKQESNNPSHSLSGMRELLEKGLVSFKEKYRI